MIHSEHVGSENEGNVSEVSGASDVIVSISGLSKNYGDFEAVKNLDLSISRGEIFAFLGPNGAGKTTTIRMLMGILQPSGGSAEIDGFDCFSGRVDVMKRVGYLPDEPIFYDYLSGGEVLRFVGEMRGFSASETSQRYAILVERLELGDALEEFAVNYSKGMKKKLALICALLHDPSLLILDEPTNGLDPATTRTLHTILQERAGSGVTILFSTHLLDQAERLCHRIGIINEGVLSAVGTLEELRNRLSPGGSLEDLFFAVTGSDDASMASPDGASE